MKQPYIRPYGKPIREPLWLRVAKWGMTAIATILFTALLAVVVIEWMAGCGETYIDSKGVRHANECVFLPYHK